MGVAAIAVMAMLLGVGMWLTLRGKYGIRKLTAPQCRKCGYDVRTYTGEPPTRCNECGADLTPPDAVRFGGFEPSYKYLVAGGTLMGLCAMSPLLILQLLARPAVVVNVPTTQATRAWLSGAGWPGPAASMAGHTTAGLVAELGQKPFDGRVWDEIQRRRRDGRMSGADVPAVIEAFTTTNGGPGQPPASAAEFVRDVLTGGQVAQDVRVRLARAVYGESAEVTLRPAVRPGRRTLFFFAYGQNRTLPPLGLVYTLRGVLVDGGTAVIARDAYTRTEGPLDGYTGQRVGFVRVDAPPGPHTLVFLFDASVASPPATGPAPPATRPRPVRWTVATAVGVNVVDRPGGDVELVTDPALDPQKPQGVYKKPAIRLSDVTLDENAKGGPKLTVGLNFGFSPIGQAYRVDVIVGGRTFACGQAFMLPDRGARIGVHAVPEDFPPDATTCTVVLTPDTDQPYTDGRIWGMAVTFAGVPIRYAGR